MTASPSLGERMKAYEAPWKLSFPRRLPVVYRTGWEVQPAPRFVAEPGGFLAEQIPPMRA